MKKRIAQLCFLLVVSSTGFAQLDSTYIAQYEKSTAFSILLGNNYLVGISETEKTGKERTYKPNNPLRIGLGVSIYNTVINLGLSYGLDFMRDKTKGKTKATDIQFHKYGRKFIFDVYYQRYTGFYAEKDERVIGIFSNMKMSMYGAQGQYVFNNKKFSAPAAFNRSEKQLKSAGTFLVGLGVYHSQIESDSIFTDRIAERFTNFQMGVNGGYAYTMVVGRYWIASGSITVGVNVGSENFSQIWNNTRVRPTAMMRMGTAYTRNNWSIGLSYVNNMTTPSFNNSKSFMLLSGNLQMNYTLRLGPIPLVSKVVNHVDRAMGWTRR